MNPAQRRFAVIALLTTLTVGGWLSLPLRAQTMTPTQAEQLLDRADGLRQEANDPAAAIAAYERALAAYEALGDRDQSLQVIVRLMDIQQAQCETDAVQAWIDQALALLADMDLTQADQVAQYTRWIGTIGDRHRYTRANRLPMTIYEAGLQRLATLAPAQRTPALMVNEAVLITRLLRAMHQAQPDDTARLQQLQQQLLTTRQQEATMRQVSVLLQDMQLWPDDLPRSPELVNTLVRLSRTANYPVGEYSALIVQGEQALLTEDYAGAIAAAEQALAVLAAHPTLAEQYDNTRLGAPYYLEPPAWRILAEGQAGQGNVPDAIAHYEAIVQAIETYPDSVLHRNPGPQRIRLSEVFDGSASEPFVRSPTVARLADLHDQMGALAQAMQIRQDYGSLAEPMSLFSLPRPRLTPPLPLMSISRGAITLCTSAEPSVENPPAPVLRRVVPPPVPRPFPRQSVPSPASPVPSGNDDRLEPQPTEPDFSDPATRQREMIAF